MILFICASFVWLVTELQQKRGAVFCYVKKKKKCITVPAINTRKHLYCPLFLLVGSVCGSQASPTPWQVVTHSSEGATKGKGGKTADGNCIYQFHFSMDWCNQGKLRGETLVLISVFISQENHCRETPERPSLSPKNLDMGTTQQNCENSGL